MNGTFSTKLWTDDTRHWVKRLTFCAPHALAWSVLSLLIFCWLRVLPWSGNLLWGTHNKLFDVQRALGVVDAWRAGYWDARWFQNFDLGYGHPFLLYYAPLFHWISGGLTLLLGSPVLALQYNLALWLVVGTIGMYVAGNQLWKHAAPSLKGSWVPGFVSACGWLMSPYLMCNVFVRGTLSEFASSQTLPWLVYLALRHFSGEEISSGTCLATAVVFSGAILTHNFLGLCAFLFGGLLLGFALLRALLLKQAFHRRFLQTAGSWCAAMALALACTAFFWMPALLDQKYVNIKQILLYRYSDHFLYWSNLVQLNFWGYGLSMPGPHDYMPLHLGYVSFVAACSGVTALMCALLSRQSRLGWMLAKLLGATAVAVLVTTWVSKPIWDRFSLLQNGQFPWRLLSFGALGCSLLLPSFFVALEVCAGIEFKEKSSPVLLLIVATCSVFSQKQYGHVSYVFAVADEVISQSWRQFSVTSTEQGEYQPIWSVGKTRGENAPGQVLVSQGVQATPVQDGASSGSWRWRVVNTTNTPTDVPVALNYFPAWRAWDLTRKIQLEVAPEENTGFLKIIGVVPGECELKLYFANTPVRQAAWVITVAGVSVFLWMAGRAVAQRWAGLKSGAGNGQTGSETKKLPATELFCLPARGLRIQLVPELQIPGGRDPEEGGASVGGK